MDVKYYDEILDLGVFSKKDIEKVIQNPKTAESFLSRSLKKRIYQKSETQLLCCNGYRK